MACPVSRLKACVAFWLLCAEAGSFFCTLHRCQPKLIKTIFICKKFIKLRVSFEKFQEVFCFVQICNIVVRTVRSLVWVLVCTLESARLEFTARWPFLDSVDAVGCWWYVWRIFIARDLLRFEGLRNCRSVCRWHFVDCFRNWWQSCFTEICLSWWRRRNWKRFCLLFIFVYCIDE